MENFSFKCSKIGKNALYLNKSMRTVMHEWQNINSSGFTFYCPIRACVKCYLLVWQILNLYIYIYNMLSQQAQPKSSYLKLIRNLVRFTLIDVVKCI